MDIKDLIKHSPSPPPSGRCGQPPSTYVPSPPNHPPPSQILPRPDSFLRSTYLENPLLPSPAPTISNPANGYYPHRSPPSHIKSEYPDSANHGWSQHMRHAPPHHDYGGYPHSSQYRDPSLSVYSTGKRTLKAEENDAKRERKKAPNQKWDSDEDARIIELRGSGMKWADISKHLPGRTEIGCRLHYQNYLERRGDWDELKKTKLARVYERLKADLWQPVATELNIPWRSAEAMHWMLGERDIARRANTVPFSIVSGANTAGPQGEGNGRVAQTNRMHDSTIHFETHDVNSALNSGAGANGPVSVFGRGLPVTGQGSLGDEDSAGGGRSYQGCEGDEDASDELDLRRRNRMQDNPTTMGNAVRLPSLANLDEGISNYTRDESQSAYRRHSTHDDQHSCLPGPRDSIFGYENHTGQQDPSDGGTSNNSRHLSDHSQETASSRSDASVQAARNCSK